MVKLVDKIENVHIPFLIADVPNHKDIKPLILEDIKKLGVNPLSDTTQNLANTDWHLGRDVDRAYITHMVDVITPLYEEVRSTFEYPAPLICSNYWFQQYTAKDYHGWHIHAGALFSCVYYVDMGEGTPRTSFNLMGKEFEVEAKEGQVLIFPSFLLHCSKENKSEKLKTVISFNLESL